MRNDLLEPKTAQRQVGDVRSVRLLQVLVGLSAIAFGALLYLTSYMNFFFDEWDFISYDRSWQLQLFWLAHNEHWSTIPIVVWKLLFVLVGIRSHIPYEAVLLATHVAAVLLLFALIRRRSGDLPAFAAALILLVLGSGATDIVWAFQIGFVASVAFGLLAMLLLDGTPPFPGRLLPVAAALLCSLMCSGVGLAFLAAVGVELLVDPHRRRFLLALVAPSLAFGEWFLAFGAGLPASPGAPCPTCRAIGFSADIRSGPVGLDYVWSLLKFVESGLAASAAGIFGLLEGGAALLFVIAVLVGWHWYRQGGLHSWQVGMTAGIFVWFTLTGLGRLQFGPAAAGESRYVYIGAVFLLPLVADAARQLPWRQLWRPSLGTLFAISLFANIFQLRDRALNDVLPTLGLSSSQVESMQIEDAELQTVEVFRGAPDMALNRSIDDRIMPQLNAGPYLAAVAELGSPVQPATVDALHKLSPQAVDTVMLNLFGGAVKVNSDNMTSTSGLVCQSIDASSGSLFDLQVPDGQSIMLQASKAGEAFLFLSYLAPPLSDPLQHFQIEPAVHEWVYLPNTGKFAIWQLRIRTGALGLMKVCSSTSVRMKSDNATYSADAATGSLNPGWSTVFDADARHGRAAKASGGTFVTFESNVFGSAFVPITGRYDVWYRVRVQSAGGVSPEMLLGLWDDEGTAWVGLTTFKPDQTATAYTWVRVASAVAPPPGDHVQFIAAFTGRLSTDWYIDWAEMLPTGSVRPT